MKKLCLAGMLAGSLAAPNLFAGMEVTLMDKISQYSYGNGGEFRAVGNAALNSMINWSAYSSSTKGTVDSSDVGSWGYNSGLAGQAFFQTFCIEYNEEFSPGTSYSVSLSDNALYGHVGAAPGTPVTLGTAWLYKEFAAGTLQDSSGHNYSYGSGRTTDAGALQQAIWYFQNENNGVENYWAKAAEAALSGTTEWDPANGMWGVKALNLGNPGSVQDQLAIVPVPEPTTLIAGALLLLPFGASAVRILRRKA